ncbi:MAG: hypothetical protein LIR50_11910 [Bacillota bacterium]|nr:hypothetical protein [Bacillota bacterium]
MYLLIDLVFEEVVYKSKNLEKVQKEREYLENESIDYHDSDRYIIIEDSSYPADGDAELE